MNRQAITLSLLACAIAASVPAHADASALPDPVRTSFERMLDHTPSAAAPLAQHAQHDAPLLAQLLRALPTAGRPVLAAPLPTAAEQLVAATPEDPLAAAFLRMLGHQPSAGSLQVASAAADPLAVLLSARLWPARGAQAATAGQP